MTGAVRPIRLALASASDVLCLEVSTQLAQAIDGVVDTTPPPSGDADWSARVVDHVGRQVEVEVARVPFEREAIERRRRVLSTADVVLLIADAMVEAIPIAEAALAEVRSSSDVANPLVVFGIGSAAGGGPDADALREALGLHGTDVVIAAGSSDRDSLRTVCAFAVRAASLPVTPAAPAPTPEPAVPRAAAPAVAPAAATAVDAVVERPVAPYGVELDPNAAASGSVEIAAAAWSALAELVGGMEHRSDERRMLLVSGLLAHGLLVERHQLAGEDAMWIQPVVAPTAAVGRSPHAAPAAGDQFQSLKDVRQNVFG